MQVKKRNGNYENVSFDKITKRIKVLLYDGLDKVIDPIQIAQKLCSSIFNGITTSEIDELTANICISMSTTHPYYGILASRLVIDNYQKNTKNLYINVVEKLYNNKDPNGNHSPLVSDRFYDIVKNNHIELENMLVHDRDYLIDYFGFKTLLKAYLLKVDKVPIERIQHMWLRCSIGIHFEDLKSVKETYDLLSQKYFIHATPTLYHAGTPRPQLASCFLENTEILTMTRGKQKIQDVHIGDIIVSHTGKARKVTQLHKNPLGERKVYKLSIEKTKDIYVTGNHRFMTLENDKKTWKKIEDMKSGDILEMTSNYNGFSRQLSGFKYNDCNVELTENMSYFIGMFLNYGKIIRNNGNVTGFMIKCRYGQQHDFMTECINDDFKQMCYLGETYKVKVVSSNMFYVEYEFEIPKFGQYLYNLFYNNVLGKLFYRMDTLNFSYFLYGFFSDEKIDEDANFLTFPNENITDQFYYLFRMRGLITEIIEPCVLKIYTKLDFLSDNITPYLKINSVEPVNLKPEYVYTLGIEEDHSYNVEGIICENCYLLGIKDSIKGIYKNLTDCALISKWAGGIGIHISNIRSNDSYIRKTGGKSTGIIPMLKVYDNTAKYVNQSGRRPGSFAMYLEPHHADIFDFLDAKRPHGSEDMKARDLFYAMWISDYFMMCVENDDDWYLMNPNECPNLNEVFDSDEEKAYTNLYKKYVSEGKYVKQVKAREVWDKILISQIETGTPYMGYKDAVNKKSNQRNVGVIKSSNLCVEVNLYSDEKEYAVCNLASVSLPSFVIEKQWDYEDSVHVYTIENCSWCLLAKSLLEQKNIPFVEISIKTQNEKESLYTMSNIKTFPQILVMKRTDDLNKSSDKEIHYLTYTELWNVLKPEFDHKKLFDVVCVATKNINKIIDVNFYPVVETEKSNLKHRPIGIGVQGLADLFIKFRFPFESKEALQLNEEIFETMYYASLYTSNQLAQIEGVYSSYEGSPLSKGLFQFDLWKETPTSGRWDWDQLREKILKYGVRNSTLLAVMPTASTSQILGNQECIEPYTSNLYTRRTIAGEFTVINKYLINDLIHMKLWNEMMMKKLIYYKGSVQNIKEIPEYIRNIYKTAWEIKQKNLIDQSAARGKYVCQSQSLNIFLEKPTYKLLTNVHFYGWKKGLKTGSYYIRSKPVSSAQNFTIDPELEKQFNREKDKNTQNTCVEENYVVCESCSG